VAESKAFKALNPNLRDVRVNQDEIKSIGRTLLDEGVIGKVPASYETLASRAQSAKESAGQNIEEIVNDLASKENVPSLSRAEMANHLKEKLLSDEAIPGVSKIIQKYRH
jgi:hypothetical protein